MTKPETMLIQRTLRGWLRCLHESGRLATARPGVALEHELAAVAKRLDGVKAVLFPGPGGHAMPVISGLVSSRAWIAEAMGAAPSQMLARFLGAAENPVPCREITDAVVQQVRHDNVDIRKLLPVPKHSEHDSAPYITAGLVIARNPATGRQNVSINRIQIDSPKRMAMLILPRHLHAFVQMAEERGEALPVAVVIGVDPLTLLASQAVVPVDHDELEIAGALHGAPLEVVKCLTSEVRVPANAEIVIEGRILNGVREPEGPFGEFPKYYSPRDRREVIEIDCVTHRRNPLYHTIVPAEMEHLLLGAIPREATILAHLKRSFTDVLDVHLSTGGVCRYHLYVQIRKRNEGQPKNVICAAFGAHYDIKHVVVVDEDVDVHDPVQVEWAVATRFQADSDLVRIDGALGSILDPSSNNGVSAKLGFDATRPLRYEEHRFTRVRIPGEDAVDLERVLQPLAPSVVKAMLDD